MTLGLVVCRPEPGNSVTTGRLRAHGLQVDQMPLFAVAPVEWVAPDPGNFDALLLTSANAVRHGGNELAKLTALPVIAVGEETAAAAREARFIVAATGERDAHAVLDLAAKMGFVRLLRLAGREHTDTGDAATAIVVYGGDPLPIAPGATKRFENDWIVLLHSARAARRFAEIVHRDGAERSRIRIAALSEQVRAAAGPGWAWAEAAAAPKDALLVQLAHDRAIDRPGDAADKADMIDDPALPTPSRQNRAWRMTAILLAIAFVAGLAAMALVMRHWNSWFTTAPVATEVPMPAQQAIAPTTPQTINPAPIAPAADLGTLTTQEGQLAAQVANLEARTAAISASAQQAEGYATRAEGLMLAFAARRAIDRGLGLGYIEGQLRARFGSGQPRAVATVLAAAREPVTIEDLRIGLDGVAPQLTNGGMQAGWWSSFTREIGNLVVIHKADAPSPLPADRLTRARRMIEAGQVEAALAEVSRMPGASAAKGWTDAARHYVETRRALDALETASVLGQAADTTPTPIGG